MSKRLTDEDVRAIRADTGPQKALADRYGVSQTTISRIKRGLARQNVEDGMTNDTEPAVEGGVIEPSPPDEPLGAGEQRVEGTSEQPVHLGDGRTLAMGETAAVSADVAEILIGSGQAKAA